MLKAFLLDYFIFIIGAPLQVLGILAALSLRSKDIRPAKVLLLISSLLTLLVFLYIVITEAIYAFTTHDLELFPQWDEEHTSTIFLSLWLIGMAGQMAAILLLSLRFQKNHERTALLETIHSERQNSSQP